MSGSEILKFEKILVQVKNNKRVDNILFMKVTNRKDETDEKF